MTIKKVQYSHIMWDCDEQDGIILPTETTLEVDIPDDASEDEVEELVSDALTAKYDYCHGGFRYKI